MVDPVDPVHIKAVGKLPKPTSFEHWRERVIAQLRGRVSQADFDFAFDAVLRWMDGREIEIDQARWSVTDIFIAFCHVAPGVILQRCEESGVTILTVTVRGTDGQPLNQRTRTLNITEPNGEPKPAATLQLRKRA